MENNLGIETLLNEDKTEFYASKIASINAKLKAVSFQHDDANTRYMISSLGRLYNMMNDCQQYDFDFGDEPVLVDRVVKLNRFIPNYILDFYGINRVLYGGCFIILPMYLLPVKKVNKSTRHNRGAVMNPEEYGLPSNSLVNYGTIKWLNNGVVAVLPKGVSRFIDEQLDRAKFYEYVYMV